MGRAGVRYRGRRRAESRGARREGGRRWTSRRCGGSAVEEARREGRNAPRGKKAERGGGRLEGGKDARTSTRCTVSSAAWRSTSGAAGAPHAPSRHSIARGEGVTGRRLARQGTRRKSAPMMTRPNGIFVLADDSSGQAADLPGDEYMRRVSLIGGHRSNSARGRSRSAISRSAKTSRFHFSHPSQKPPPPRAPERTTAARVRRSTCGAARRGAGASGDVLARKKSKKVPSERIELSTPSLRRTRSTTEL